MADGRTPAQIEADIVRKRQDLAATLDEIAVRVHPQTLMGDAKARAASALDRTAGRAYAKVDRTVSAVRAQLVTEDGRPRMDRVVPAALVAIAVIGVLALSHRSYHRGGRRRGR